MTADSNSHIAWQRAQLKKYRAALKEVEASAPAAAKFGRNSRMTIAELQRKVAESGRCIAEYERKTRRPLGTDVGSLSNVSWTHWSASPVNARAPRRA